MGKPKNEMRIIEGARLEGRRLYLKTLKHRVPEFEAKRKIGTIDCVWDPDLVSNFMEQKEWLSKRYARITLSPVLFGTKNGSIAAVFNRLDENHHKPNHLSIPAANWGLGVTDILDSSLNQLGIEVIPALNDSVAVFEHRDYLIANSYVDKFASINGKERSLKKVKIIEFCSQDENVVEIYLDNRYQGPALLSVKPETGSIEIIMLFQLHHDHHVGNIQFFDGKILPTGNYRNSQSGLFTLTDLIHESLTSKAENIKQFLELIEA